MTADSRQTSTSQDEAEVRSVVARWPSAVREEDRAAIREDHDADIVMFDVPPSTVSRGLDAYMATWKIFFPGPGSVDSLNMRMRWGASWWASRIRCTERRLTPAAFARIRTVQWVASPAAIQQRSAWAAVGDVRLKLTAIHSGDVHHNSCSHDESLNCFGRFGNRPNESGH
jgi:hypothetical protein